MTTIQDYLQAQSTLGLSPGYLAAGDTLTISVQSIAWGLVFGGPLLLELVEVDWRGGSPVPLARFQVQVGRRGVHGPLEFKQVRRLTVEGEQDGDREPPEPRADTSQDGAVTFPFQTTWKRAELLVLFAGLGPETHRVVVRQQARQPEQLVYEIGVRVTGFDGALVFDSGTQFATLDCWNAMIHNCAAAAETLLRGHHHLVDTRGRGDHYGSNWSGTPPPGAIETDCITFCLQVLRRAYEELGAEADARLLDGADEDGTHFAVQSHAAGWKLIYLLHDEAQYQQRDRSSYDGLDWITHHALQRQRFRVITDGKLLANVPLEEVVHSFQGSGSARYDALGELPFMVLALDLGYHMSMKVGERIYECHWSKGPEKKELFDRSTLTWPVLKQGVYTAFYAAIPPTCLQLTFPGKSEEERKAMLEPDWDQICAGA